MIGNELHLEEEKKVAATCHLIPARPDFPHVHGTLGREQTDDIILISD